MDGTHTATYNTYLLNTDMTMDESRPTTRQTGLPPPLPSPPHVGSRSFISASVCPWATRTKRRPSTPSLMLRLRRRAWSVFVTQGGAGGGGMARGGEPLGEVPTTTAFPASSSSSSSSTSGPGWASLTHRQRRFASGVPAKTPIVAHAIGEFKNFDPETQVSTRASMRGKGREMENIPHPRPP